MLKHSKVSVPRDYILHAKGGGSVGGRDAVDELVAVVSLADPTGDKFHSTA